MFGDRSRSTIVLLAVLFGSGTAVADTGEPNDAFHQAVPLTSGMPVVSYISTSNDLDYYTFSTSSTQHVRAELTVPAGRTYALTLLSAGPSTPQPVANGEGGGAGVPQRIDWTLPAGIYWIRVQTGCCSLPGYDAVNPYTLTITAPQVGDTFEPNETPSTATPLVAGEARASFIATDNDIDYYAFVLPGTQHIRIDLAVPADRSYTLTLFAAGPSTPQPIAHGQGGGAGLPQRIDWTVPAGAYWVRVAWGCCSPITYDPVHPYTLLLTAPQPGDTFEPNETTATAAALQSGQLRTSFIATSNDVDYYTFTVVGTQHVRLDLTVPAERSYTVALLGAGASTPQPLTHGQGGGAGIPQRIDWTVPAGTYWVRVAWGCCSPITYDPVHPYTLLLTAPQPGDTFEPNETVASATPLLSGQPLTSFIATSNDIDYYAFTLSVARQVQLRLEMPAQQSYALTLLGAGGYALAQGQGGGSGVPEQIDRNLEPGTYWVQVAYGCCSPLRYDPVQPYTLLLTGGDPPGGSGASDGITLTADVTTRLVGGAVVLTARVADSGGQPRAGAAIGFHVDGTGIVGGGVSGSDGLVRYRLVRSVPGSLIVRATTGTVQSTSLTVTWDEAAFGTSTHPDPSSPATFSSPLQHPIVFVHGFRADASTWNKVINESFAGLTFGGVATDPNSTSGLAADGSQHDMYGIQFTDRNIAGGLDEWGSELSRYLQRIRDVRRVPTQFVIVAHSAGGLAARQYMQSTGYRGDVNALITYGTPHAGATPHAFCGIHAIPNSPVDCSLWSQGVEDMIPGSAFLQRLDQRFLPRSARYVSVIGTQPATCKDYIEKAFNVFIPEPNDCVVPAGSQNLALAFSATGRDVKLWRTSQSHMSQTSDSTGLIKALELAGVPITTRPTLAIEVRSPVDVIVADPLGRQVSATLAEIPYATYEEVLGDDGARHDWVVVPFAVPGEYRVSAIAHPGAGQSETYSIVKHRAGIESVIADDVAIADIPVAGYAIANTERRYLAEGATNSFFSTRLALLNPETVATQARVRFLTGSGAVVAHDVLVPARTRVTVDPATLPGLSASEFSTVVESDHPLVVDRTMSWNRTGYGSHSETAVSVPSPVWYLAEGATLGDFALFYLLQNPTSASVTARIRYLRTQGSPLEKLYTLPPRSRTNVWVNVEEFPGHGRALASAEVSAVIETLDGSSIIAERAMYRTRRGRTFDAGHESMGVSAPSTRWFLAEGATGPYFDMFVLIANPSEHDAQVQVTYLLGDGTTYSRPMVAPASARSGIWVDMEQIPGVEGFPLADVAVSTTIESLNDVPLVVERAMWWPGDASNWHEAHNSAGATEAGTRWAVAEGSVGGSSDDETYLLIANTSTHTGSALVTLMFEDGSSDTRTYTLLPNSRANVPIKEDFPSASGRRFGAVVESTGSTPARIVVERAMYSNAGGVKWAAGTNALATRLR